jgi:tetratricopeptide (TPR) repeat protein
MKKLSLAGWFVFFVSFCVTTFFSMPVFAGGGKALEEGIAQYKEENYEEAIEKLAEVRRLDPASSEAAFFLGMAYKQVVDNPKAENNLKDAVTLVPRIKEALLELADALYQQGKTEEAVKWLKIAEEEGIFPDRTAFLKGLILVKQDRNSEAVAAFEKSRQLNQAFAQAAEFQIAICLIKDRKLDLAKARLQAAITRDPLSDLASFARQYQEMVDERLYQERPLRLTVDVMGSYDSNLVSKPIDEAAAGNITDEKAYTLTSSVRLDFVPKLEGQWLFNAQYAAMSSVNSVHTHSHDSFANSFSISPGYNFGRFAVNLNANYTSVLLRTDPDPATSGQPDSNPGYKRYLDYSSISPSLRMMLNQNNILEFSVGYDKKDYFNQTVASPDAVRDSVGPHACLSWIWLFREDSFLNLRYDYNRERADGWRWNNTGNRLTANLSIPVIPAGTAQRIGPVTLQLTGSVFIQDYDYEDVSMMSGEREKRRDKIYTGSAAITWNFCKYSSLIAQYIRTESDSNWSIHEYSRNQYLLGMEFRY